MNKFQRHRHVWRDMRGRRHLSRIRWYLGWRMGYSVVLATLWPLVLLPVVATAAVVAALSAVAFAFERAAHWLSRAHRWFFDAYTGAPGIRHLDRHIAAAIERDGRFFAAAGRWSRWDDARKLRGR